MSITSIGASNWSLGLLYYHNFSQQSHKALTNTGSILLKANLILDPLHLQVAATKVLFTLKYTYVLQYCS